MFLNIETIKLQRVTRVVMFYMYSAFSSHKLAAIKTSPSCLTFHIVLPALYWSSFVCWCLQEMIYVPISPPIPNSNFRRFLFYTETYM